MSHKTAISKRIATIRSPKVQADVYKSEYQDAFKSWPWQPPREAIRPTVIRGVSTLSYPADMVSCTHRAFVPHKPKGPPRSYKPKVDDIAKPDVKMDTATTYNAEFHEKVANPRPPPFKPDEKLAENKPFNEKSVYQAHFKQFSQEEIDACKVEMKPHSDNLGTDEKPAFNAQSTAQDSFRPLGKVTPASSLKPEETSHIDHSQPFVTETTHRAEFTPKALPAPHSSVRNNPVINIPTKYRHAREAFDDLTVFKRDFVDHRVTKPEQSYKPRQIYRRNPSKFDGRTTHRMSYQPIPIAANKPRPPWANRGRTVVVSKAQRARLDLLTSYQEDFRDPARLIPMEKCRGVTYKVENNLSGSGAGAGGDKRAPMEAKTSYKMSYIPYERAKRAESFKMTHIYETPTAPFFGVSTSSAHYRGKLAPPAKSCRPPARPRSSPGKMSSWTTYRATFGRRAASCPPPSQTCAAVASSSLKQVANQTPTAPPNTAADPTPQSSNTKL